MKEKILKILKDNKKSLEVIEIANFLNLDSSLEYEELNDSINSLIEDGEILFTKKNKLMLLDDASNLKLGKIRINRYGHGYITADKDYFIHKNNLKNAIHGDVVLIEAIPFVDEGKVIRVVKRDLNNLVGLIKVINGNHVFIPKNEKLNINIKIKKESLKNIVDGQLVLVKIVKTLKNNNYIGEIEHVIGHENDPNIDILTIAYKHGIREEFNEKSFKEIDAIEGIKTSDIEKRVDLRDKVIFTLDGDDTKDIDDAISLEIVENNYVLGVHIADVAHYVMPGTSLFKDAEERANSNYLADTVIPMIPHELSNGICSLNENEDRLAMSVIITINKDGKVKDFKILETVIKSKKQMTYNNVNKILNGELVSGYEEYKESLLNMNDLAHLLRKEKYNNGYLDFDIPEAGIKQDENGKCIEVYKRIQRDAENIIEDFMIITNEVVAKFLSSLKTTSIYRVHDLPNTEKLEETITYLNMRGLKIGIHNVDRRTIQEILEKVKKFDEREILNDLLLRSMDKARYDINNIGHYGLGSNCYTHFTAPIRRFSDLIIHHILKQEIFNNNYKNILTTSYLDDISKWVSEKEKETIEAERTVLDLKMAEYMEDRIGETFEGRISAVMEFGFFVTLDNLVEGLVHISSLRGYFKYIPEYKMLSSDNKTYTLGDKIKIIVVQTNKENGTIDFEVVK